MRKEPAPADESSSTTPKPDPFLGRILSHYRLEARLGSGGMGVVYRATDLTLGRAVAIKLLSRHLATSEDAKARFLREARAASALDHPNIGAIHDAGEQDGELFMVMALFEGETLKQRLEKGRLPASHVKDILRQMAWGLEAAHAAGIIHRDIKSANVLLTQSGAVKLLDFGLAKVLLDEVSPSVTRAGDVVGTPLYMSPELLRGKAADARTDLWSLGVVAYELLSGASPFKAESSAAIAARILHEDPPSLNSVPGVPPWLAELVRQLLQKNPDARVQTASELRKRLEDPSVVLPGDKQPRVARGALSEEWASVIRRRRMFRIALLMGTIVVLLGAGAIYLYLQRVGKANIASRIKSLAVLPFTISSDNADTEYLADGITEDLIDSLSQIPELQVIARTTAFRYKGKEVGKEVDLQRLRRELSVDALLTGHVQHRGDALVIHVDLIDLKTGSQLWGERFNRKLDDGMRMQGEMTKAISEELRPRLTTEVQQRVTRRYTENDKAYQLYRLGRHLLNMRPNDEFLKARDYFQRALEVDPKYALAYTGVADYHLALAWYSSSGPLNKSYANAEAAVTKALNLDDQLAEAHASLGQIKLGQWDWENARNEHKRAIDLNPNYATAHHWYAEYLRTIGHFEEALYELKQAQRLDPQSTVILRAKGMVLCETGQHDSGLATLKEALEIDPNPTDTRGTFAFCYLEKKKYQEAIDELKQACVSPAASSRTAVQCQAWFAYAYAKSGKKDDAQRILTELQKQDEKLDAAFNIAVVYTGLDDGSRAFEWLDKAYQRRSAWLEQVKIGLLNPLKSDPRYTDLLRRMGLPP